MITVDDAMRTIMESDIVVNLKGLKADTPFKELHLDSLDRAAIYLSIEERYGIKIPEEDVADLDTLRALTDYVNIKLGS